MFKSEMRKRERKKEIMEIVGYVLSLAKAEQDILNPVWVDQCF